MASAIGCPSYDIREESQVHFYALFLRAPESEQHEWRVGVEGSAIALELPAEGARAIQILQMGKSIAETTALIQQEFDEDVDLVEFIKGLAELGLVSLIDDHQFNSPKRIGQKWLQRIPPKAVGWLYSQPALIVYATLLLVGPLLLLFQPALRPHAQDLLWSPSYSLDLLLLLVLGPLLLLKHEFGHLLAARAKGLPAELTFGHRLFYLVAVSRIGEIWKRSRFERLLIYSAGMLNDGMTASLCLLLLFVGSHGTLPLPPSLVALLRFIALSQYLGIVWQFQIFFKTDVYYIFTEHVNRHDVPEQASAFLRALGHTLFAHSHPGGQQKQPVSADKLTLGYIALSMIGIGASYVWFVFYSIPATLLALHGEIGLLITSIHAKNGLGILDALAALSVQLVCFSLLGWSIVRKHIQRFLQHKENHAGFSM